MRYQLTLTLLTLLLIQGFVLADDPAEQPQDKPIKQASFAAQPEPQESKLSARKPDANDLTRKRDGVWWCPFISSESDSANQRPPANATSSEIAIWKALRKPATLKTDKQPLSDVMRKLAQDFGINIVVDSLGLNEVGLTPETPISMEVDGIKLKSVLNLMLLPQDLAFMIKNEVLVITSKTRAQGKRYVVSYPVADLVIPIPMTGPVSADEPIPVVNRNSVDFNSLIEVIEASVQPVDWERLGGTGSIRAFDPTMCLVIRQSKEAHQEIETLLTELRRQRDFHVSVETRILENLPDKAWERLGLDLDANSLMARTQQNKGPLGGVLLNDEEVKSLLEAAQNHSRTNLIQPPEVALLNGYTAHVTEYTAGGKPHPLQRPFYLQPVISADRREVRLNLRVSDQQSEPQQLQTYVTTVPDGKAVLIELVAQKTNQTGVPVTDKAADAKVFKKTTADQTRTFLLLRPKIIVQQEEEEPVSPPAE